MAFTAQDVKKLREMTNVGMMDCKKALQATDGDMDKAVDWLREKGLAKAAKKADRIAAEGMAYATVCPECGVGAIVEVNCETDFCANSAPFRAFVKDLATVVIKDAPADVDALMNCTYPGSALTVAGILPEKVMAIGENLQIRRFARFDKNVSVAYVHAGGSHGVLVNLAVEGDADVTEIGKNVAMQIAAMGPKYWDKSLVPQDVVAHEMEVQVALMDNDPKMASKPAQVKEKIAAGKLNAFYKEICLLQQDFVRGDLFTGSVEGYIADAGKQLGVKVKFVDAIHYVRGEGIEKKVDDFAAEVAAQIAGAQK
ncbi:MAG: translation elongation factor Ts [Faecousia sp.]